MAANKCYLTGDVGQLKEVSGSSYENHSTDLCTDPREQCVHISARGLFLENTLSWETVVKGRRFQEIQKADKSRVTECNLLWVFFFICFIYLKARAGEMGLSSIYCVMPQMATMVSAWPGGNQELGAASKSPIWVLGPQEAELSSAAFPGILAWAVLGVD